jgi:hypothetical protein
MIHHVVMWTHPHHQAVNARIGPSRAKRDLMDCESKA